MALHPIIQAALASAEKSPPYHTLPIAQARARVKLAYRNDGPPTPVAAVRNLRIPGPGGEIPLRIYTPPGEAPFPVLVFFHGSGFVVLDLDTHDEICRQLCIGASCTVVSVDYRLAPEYKFPAAPDDCLAATRWVYEHGATLGADAGRMAVCGDSAGGCLAAVTALRIRDEGGLRLRGQLLIYSVTDHPSTRTSTYAQFGSGFGLTAERMEWFWDQYLPDTSAASHPHASPLRAPSMAGLPAAYVLTAEFDILRDEGEAFAQRLRDAGVAVVSVRAPGMNHGFLKYTARILEARAAFDDACRWLRETLA